MKIVMLSDHDYAGSGMRMRDAFRRHYPEDKIILVTYGKAAHESDFCIAEMINNTTTKAGLVTVHEQIRNKSVLRHARRLRCVELQELVNDCDIVHFKGDEPPTRNWHDLIIVPEDKKIVVSVGGSGFRRKAAYPEAARALWPMEDYMLADLRTALTPDLNYPEYKGIYTQQAIDSESALLLPLDLPEHWKPQLLVHSPSHRDKKGTDAVFLPAVQKLRSSGRNISLEIIERLSYQKSVEAKAVADLFFDQAGVGFYGNSALEAMQFGVPTICHISREAMQQSNGKITTSHPVFAMRKASVASCFTAMKKAYDCDWEQRAIETKEFCDSFHGYSAVSKMWFGLYNELLKG